MKIVHLKKEEIDPWPASDVHDIRISVNLGIRARINDAVVFPVTRMLLEKTYSHESYYARSF